MVQVRKYLVGCLFYKIVGSLRSIYRDFTGLVDNVNAIRVNSNLLIAKMILFKLTCFGFVELTCTLLPNPATRGLSFSGNNWRKDFKCNNFSCAVVFHNSVVTQPNRSCGAEKIGDLGTPIFSRYDLVAPC
jgi:hypothetical protein